MDSFIFCHFVWIFIFYFLGTLVTLPSATSHVFPSVCVCVSLTLILSPSLTNSLKLQGHWCFKTPHGGNLPPPETPQAFQHLFLIPEITPLATTWGPHACHFEPH